MSANNKLSVQKATRKPSHFLNLHLNNIGHCSMVSMEQNSGLQTELRAKAWERWTKRQAGQGFLGGGGGRRIHFYIFGSESTQKSKHELEGQVYLFIYSLPIPETSKGFIQHAQCSKILFLRQESSWCQEGPQLGASLSYIRCCHTQRKSSGKWKEC